MISSFATAVVAVVALWAIAPGGVEEREEVVPFSFLLRSLKSEDNAGNTCASILLMFNGRTPLFDLQMQNGTERLWHAAKEHELFIQLIPNEGNGHLPSFLERLGKREAMAQLAVYCRNFHGEVSLVAVGETKVVRATQSLQFISAVEQLHVHGQKNVTVGSLYSVWHAPASNVVRSQSSPQPPLTVEMVLRSDGQFDLSDIYSSTSNQQKAASFFYHATPELGFYCIYRKRWNETSGYVPDCPNITETLTTHAEMLHGAGVDFVAVDATNLPTFTPFSDLIQLRPAEVLAEEWTALRLKGVRTPSITIWQCIPTGATLFRRYLEAIYNNGTLTNVVYRRPSDGKMVFFVPANPTLQPDPALIAEIESNGGRNNIVVVQMWANLPQKTSDEGIWGFFSPCKDSGGKSTTTLAGLLACNQGITTNSALGSAMSVSPAYQLNYGSIPFGGLAKFGGATFQFQWATAIANVGKIDNVILSSFNELIAQPQPNHFPGAMARSMGLWNDSMGASLWVDTFGSGRGRDIEPTVEGGSAVFNMMAACIRTLRLSAGSSAAPSAILNDGCLDVALPQRTYVFSLAKKDGSDRLLSIDQKEMEELVWLFGYKQVCNSFPGPTYFCVDGSLVSTEDAIRGPFVMYAVNTTSVPSGTTTIYRCKIAANQKHFFSADPHCEGQVTEFPLGMVSDKKTSDTPRMLRRCYDTTAGMHYHALDGPCALGDNDEQQLGYVS